MFNLNRLSDNNESSSVHRPSVKPDFNLDRLTMHKSQTVSPGELIRAGGSNFARTSISMRINSRLSLLGAKTLPEVGENLDQTKQQDIEDKVRAAVEKSMAGKKGLTTDDDTKRQLIQHLQANASEIHKLTYKDVREIVEEVNKDLKLYDGIIADEEMSEMNVDLLVYQTIKAISAKVG